MHSSPKTPILAIGLFMLISALSAQESLVVNADGTLGSITINGTITSTGTISSAPGMGYVPVGTIVAWYAVTAAAVPPAGWVKCDGQTVTQNIVSGSDGDKLDGNTDGKVVVPALNTSGRFLRGGTTAGTLQDDAVERHNHTFAGRDAYIDNPYGGSTPPPGWTPPASMIGPVEFAKGSGKTYTGSLQANVTADGTVPDNAETRPVNMSVVWIIRVY